MRKVIDVQFKIGEVDISKVEFNEKKPSSMEKILKGLQYIYCNTELREEVFKILDRISFKDKSNGRPGLDLWKIFVLGAVRLGKDYSLEDLTDAANNHLKVREMLGHPDGFDRKSYSFETIRRNLQLFTPEILDEINQIVVNSGHKVMLKKKIVRKRNPLI